MNSPVLPRLYAGGLPLLRALGVVCASIFFGALVGVVRQATRPIDSALAADTLVFGLVAFLTAGSIAALAMAGSSELLNCSFAANVPSLHRRVARELLVTGLVAVVAVTFFALCAARSFDERLWLASIGAALGYSAGLVNAKFERNGRSASGWLGLMTAGFPLYLLPEIAQAVRAWGPACAAIALGLLVALAGLGGGLGPSSSNFAAARRTERRAVLGTGAASRDARNEGPSSVVKTRRSDREWIAALLHRAHGRANGGWIGSVVRSTAAVLLLNTLMQVLIAGTAAWVNSSATLELLPDLARDSGLSSEALIAAIFPGHAAVSMNGSAILAGFLVMRALPLGSATIDVPLSRLRRARLEWRQQGLEEIGVLLALLLTYAPLTAIGAHLGVEAPWPEFSRWMLGTLAIFALLPLARWMAAHLMRGAAPAGDEAQQGRDLRWNLVFALCFGVMLGGGQFIVLAELVGRLDSFSESWLPATGIVAALVCGRLFSRWRLERLYSCVDF